MLGNDVFIAFSSKKTVEMLVKIVHSGGFNIAGATLSAAELKQKISYYGSGIIICGCRFGDEDINSLLEDIPESFNIMLIGKAEQLAYCYSKNAVKLAVPINSGDLLTYLDMLRPEIPARRSKRSPAEQTIIDKAKRRLIEHYNMTEPQAHRYIEKAAMDTGKSIVEIAKKIIG